MKITFYSNFLNHHQLPLSHAFANTPGVDYTFVATWHIDSKRLELGYRDLDKAYPFVLTTYDSTDNVKKAEQLARESDLVITGWEPERYSMLRIMSGKPLFRFNERLFRSEPGRLRLAKSTIGNHLKNPPFSKVYLLAAGAYTAGDYARLGLFHDRCYKWGYFPELIQYDDFSRILREKEEGSILWCGRMLDWKHPEAALHVARALKDAGCRFTLRMIGIGEMEDVLKEQVRALGLEDCVCFLGSMSPEEVRRYMERSRIFLFTSDRNEGWGAVLNEAMNSGCAVVASHMIGSVPFLLRSGGNGLVYPNGDLAALTNAVRRLLDDPAECDRLGSAAYRTMCGQWNAENAAARLIALHEHLLSGGDGRLFADGVCSTADALREDWIYGA